MLGHRSAGDNRSAGQNPLDISPGTATCRVRCGRRNGTSPQTAGGHERLPESGQLGVQPRYGQKPPPAVLNRNFRCSGWYGLSVFGFDRSLHHQSRHPI